MKDFSKKVLAILMMVLLTIGMLPIENSASAASTERGGYGSNRKFLAPIEPPAADAIPISNRAELEAINDNLSGSYYLTQDIDLSGAEWVPIGSDTGKAFTGVFDGQGRVISNMTINVSGVSGGYGLFASASANPGVKNLGLEAINITVYGNNSKYNYLAVGGIIASNASAYHRVGIWNSYVTGEIYAENGEGFSTGGISAFALAYDCWSAANIKAVLHTDDVQSPGVNAGGIVGRGAGVFRSFNIGKVEAIALGGYRSWANAGGITAMGSDGSIKDCYNLGEISASATATDLTPSGPNNIYRSSADARAAGIAANGVGTINITNCYNAGSIISTAHSNNTDPDFFGANAFSAGIAGPSQNTNHCVDLTNGIFSSGLEDSACYLIGKEATNGLNYADASIYAENLIDHAAALYSAPEFTKQQLWEELGFDFDTIWKMPSYGGYPIFQWQDDSLLDTPTVKKRIYYKPDYDDGYIDVDWGASLFKNSSMVYNSDLALVAAALNAAADGDGLYLPNAYTTLGFNEKSYYNYPGDEILDGSIADEHCFSIASREMNIDGKKQLVIAVILRGTKTFDEMLGDIAASAESDYGIYGYKVFDYFHEFADKVWRQFWEFIDEYDIMEEYGDNIKVLVGGHSLGGAAANLFTARINLSDSEIKAENVYTFTFGALNSIGYFENIFVIDMVAQHKNINNIINYYDSFGKHGGGTDGLGIMRPAWGLTHLTASLVELLSLIKTMQKMENGPIQTRKIHILPT